MIMYGTHIRSSADELRKVDEEQVYRSLRNPKPTIAARIKQLRIIYAIDAKQYAQLKRDLPYIVCGIFSPPYRRREHFAYTDTFLVDIDHLSSKGLSLPEVRKRICMDPLVMMCFSSPSEDGLKVMFRLEERCYDAGLYSIFYKAFIRDFSSRYGLEEVVDDKTSDVTRACFISIDPEAYYNPQCEAVDTKVYADTDDPAALLDLAHALSHSESPRAEKPTPPDHGRDPDSETMERIRAKLGSQKRTSIERPVEVPKILNDVIDSIKGYVEETGLTITEITNIQYGKKVHATLGLKQAEVNLFYGKRGFSIVASPKRGTDSGLNELLTDLIRDFIETH